MQTGRRTRSERFRLDIARWNRKLHSYVGLALLLFLWLFSISGLVLNHPKWKFTEFWPQRKTSTFERSIRTPETSSDLAFARDVMQQLDIVGEIAWTETWGDSPERRFRVSRPGVIINVTANLDTGKAQVETIRINGWGALRALHTFSGTPYNDARQDRDWAFTTLWRLSMDLLAIGTIFLVLSGIYMWFPLVSKRRLGVAALALGTLSAGFFVFGLARLL